MRTFAPLPAAALFLAVLATPARAEEDAQAWGAIVAQGAVRGDLYLFLEGQGRFTDDISRAGQWIVRPAAGVRFAPDAVVLAGYAYVVTRSGGGRVEREHRPWQQVQFPLLRGGDGKPMLVNRTRLEQRMIEGAARTGWRLRQQLRLQTPVRRGSDVQAVASTEGFFNLNGTDAGARAGVDQWRTFVGVSLPIGKGTRIEPGYQNQHLFRAGEDRSNHILNVTLNLSL